MSSSKAPLFPLRTVVLGALLPAFIFSVGIGAMLPILAPTAVERGADLATAALVAGLLPIGHILADVPAGALTSRIGDRPAMMLAGLVAMGGFVAAAFSPSVLTMALAILLVGAADSVFHLARHSYLTEITPAMYRARVLSTLGGVHRIGQFVGPFLGALVIHIGDMRGVFFLAVATALAATLTVALARPKPSPAAQQEPESSSPPSKSPARKSMWRVIQEQRKLLGTLGIAVLLIGCIRGARMHVIPVWGEYIGLDPATISLIYGLAGGLDMLLFYPAGKVMDHFGRLWVGIPSMALMGIAMALLPITSTELQVALVAALLGIGNGMGSGILMTVGADVAPADSRAQFLGAWRLLQDCGMASGPLVISAGAALGSVAAGIWVTAAMGPSAAAALKRWLPRWTVHASRTTRRRAGVS